MYTNELKMSLHLNFSHKPLKFFYLVTWGGVVLCPWTGSRNVSLFSWSSWQIACGGGGGGCVAADVIKNVHEKHPIKLHRLAI